MYLFTFHSNLHFTLPLCPTFTGQKYLPLDVLPLYKKVSNLQECEGLQGDLGEPQGGQKKNSWSPKLLLTELQPL